MALHLKTKPASIKAATGASWLGALLLLADSLLCGGGCQSTETTPSSSFASVVISGNTPGQIRDTAVEIFSNNGYSIAQADPGNLVFEKEASRMNNFAYGSWLGDTPVWIRIKAGVVPLGSMTCRLQCHAYMIRDRGSAAEEEIALTRLHKAPYQKLLDDVAKRLSGR